MMASTENWTIQREQLILSDTYEYYPTKIKPTIARDSDFFKKKRSPDFHVI